MLSKSASFSSAALFSFVAAFLLIGLLALPAAGEEMSGSRAKKVLKEADAAAASGDPVKARELYQLVAAGTAKTPARRADALYGLILVEAARPAAAREAGALESALAQFLKDFAKDPRRGVVAALSGLHQENKTRDEEIAGLEARFEAAMAEQASKEAAAAGASKDSSKKVEELEARLRRAGAEVENLKSELAKKEEALKKLKKVVVGGGG